MGYASRTRYRRGSWLRRHVNRFVAWLAGVGLRPSTTVRLDVVGRRSGKLHSFAVTMAVSGDERYLVSLAGESDWVRNLRAIGGKAVICHEWRREVCLQELPSEERAPILAAYLSRTALSKSPAAAARDYFGVVPQAPADALREIAEYYPVFRINGLS